MVGDFGPEDRDDMLDLTLVCPLRRRHRRNSVNLERAETSETSDGVASTRREERGNGTGIRIFDVHQLMKW